MITHAICLSYKKEILEGIHTLSHTYKIALFTETAELNKFTTSYTGLTDEVVGTGYTAGGQELAGIQTSLSGDTALLDFTTNPSWTSSTISARGALVYNDSLAGKNAVAVIDFGSTYSSINQDFIITLPASGETTSLIRII